jgi:membrane fusion protein, multidrug efflux system
MNRACSSFPTLQRATSVLSLLALLASAAAATGCQNKAQADRSKLTKADTIVAYDLPIARTITDYAQFPGQTEAIISVPVTSRVTGYMTDVHFKDGDTIKEGDLLFKIDDRQYKADLERNQGTMEQIEAHTNRLEKEYRRAKTLIARGQISQEDHDRYEADFRETEANFKLARANYDLAKLNYEWCQVRASASGRLSRRMVDPGNMVKADDTVLTSIVSLDPMYVYFFVNEEVMKQIRLRLEQAGGSKPSLQQVPVQISFADEDEDEFPHKGTVDFTDNREVNESRTLRFRAKIDNKDHFIVPGMVVRVRLPIGEPHPAVFVRERALVTDQGEKGVYIIRERDRYGKPFANDRDKKGKEFYNAAKPFVQRAFWSKVGNPAAGHSGLVEIKDGVRAGDWVVVSGMQRLKNDKEVQAERYSQNAAAASPEQVIAAKKATASKGEPKPQQGPPMAVQDTYVTYELPTVETVQDSERIEGGCDAIFSVDVMSRVSGYMTKVRFKDGDLVKAGDLLFEIDSRQYKAELDRAEGNLQQLLAHKNRLEKEYHRAKNLIERGSISPEEFDRYESDFRETEANVKVSKANRDLAQLNYDWCEVRASTTGRLSRRMVDPGSLVKADSTVLTSIVSLDPIYVYFDVHELTMLKIKHLMQKGKVAGRSLSGIPVDISLATNRDDKFDHRALVDFTDNRVDYNRGTLAFRAKLDNKDHVLNPGLFVRVRLPIGDEHKAVMIHERALVSEHKLVDGESVRTKGVYLLLDHDVKGKPIESAGGTKGNPVPLRRAVFKEIGDPGVVRDKYVEVQGVHEGDWVVVSGMQRLKPDKLVRVEKFVEAPPTSEVTAVSESTAAPPKGEHQAGGHSE